MRLVRRSIHYLFAGLRWLYWFYFEFDNEDAQQRAVYERAVRAADTAWKKHQAEKSRLDLPEMAKAFLDERHRACQENQLNGH